MSFPAIDATLYTMFARVLRGTTGRGLAFLIAVHKSIRSIRGVIGATTSNPELLTCAERLQFERYVRREGTNAVVRRTSHSRKLVRQVIHGERTDVFRVRQSSLGEPWSNGQTEGQITKLKLERQTYGRGKLDLLQARLIAAA